MLRFATSPPFKRKAFSGSYEVQMELKYKWRVFISKSYLLNKKKISFQTIQFYKEQNPHDGGKHSILLLHNNQVL